MVWRVLTAFLWSWALALMVGATVLANPILGHWALLLGMLGGLTGGGMLIEWERRRVEEVADVLVTRASKERDLPRIGAD